MDSRFKHQDEMIENLMKIVKTFQDTLKVVGKDAWNFWIGYFTI